jgi:hypothetical protein
MFARYWPRAKMNCLGGRPEVAHGTDDKKAGQKGGPMALDTNSFLVLMAAVLVVMALVVWVMFKKAS